MKITIVTGFFLPVPPLRGGSTEKIWHRLAQELARAGHEITFVSRRWPGLPDRETRDGITHLRVRGCDHARTLAANLWHDFWWGIRVARILPQADAVICNTVTLPAWLRRVKPSAGRVVAVLARMPKGHGRAYGRVDLLLALSEAVAARLRAERPTLGRRIAVFPYPIDWALHAGMARNASLPLVIGYAGRVHPDKGVATLLGAASRLATRTDLPDWRVELVGPWAVPEGGGGDAFCERLIERFGPALGPRLTLAGSEFDPIRLARRYAAMDVFCYPSVDRGETFGVAVAEAMAAGCVPVVSELECFRELVRAGETGLTFPHRSQDAEGALSDILANLLLDAPERATLAQRARAHARRYDFPVSAAALLTRLERLVAKS